VDGAPGAAVIMGTGDGEGLATGSVSGGAGERPGDAPRTATARAATTTHATEAASPTRPARRRLPLGATGSASAPIALTALTAPTLTAPTLTAPALAAPALAAPALAAPAWAEAAFAATAAAAPAAFAPASAGPDDRGRAPARDPFDAATASPRRSAYRSASPWLGVVVAITIRERATVSISRNGAHFRQAPSTRFQQSAQQAAPHAGQSRYSFRADANESRSRPQRSQNWVPRSTVHSRPALSPQRMRHASTIDRAPGPGVTPVVPRRAAFVSFGARRQRTAPPDRGADPGTRRDAEYADHQ